ncbi:RagB/SusD family nutrient uptake outer membrane protein [Sphingobacterium arenae]|uniref:RagB/SusD family nutrient uptake outer membrane protein n=1 Tax=Sphingobacterium arenae TaxID=1280598 RepID=A0ABR7Y491_9SPHI|nr:RagB/SusD family nutrient uptake outer membrane protein [Sphingobacterium arenae]MBD1426073.1 RagB/SusD family nutrient uptake outer membrane protein [Sphingobacterium arenae]
MKKRNAIILIVTFFTVIGCKDFLDQKQNFAYSDGSSLSDIQAILDDAEYMNRRTPTFPQAASDDFFLPENAFNGRTERDRMLYMWELVDYTFPNDWANLYFQVFNANLCLENLDVLRPNITDTRSWEETYGAALFFRAHANYWLVTTFAKAYDRDAADEEPGIVIRTTSDFNVPSFRSSLRESYDHIEADLRKAVRLLPRQVEVPLRPSQAAAYGLLARIHLVKREYDHAALFADSALAINREVLNFNDVGLNLASNLPFSEKYFNEVVFYSAIGVNTTSVAHPNNGRIDSILYNTYHNDDLRKQAYFLPQGNGYRFKGMYIESVNLCFTGLTTAELLLTLAECKIRQGQVEEGLNLIDEVLMNRFKYDSYEPTPLMPQEAALSFVLEERRKELLMRGIRFADIKRLNAEGRNIELRRIVNGKEIIIAPNDTRYAMPIPLDVTQNSNIEQNQY